MTSMKTVIIAGAAFAAAALSPALADAAFNGWTTRSVAQKAGPAEFYPTINSLPGGVEVRVFGCVRDITYCDVAWRGNRGWVSGDALAGFYNDKRVPLASFGVQLGVPYVTFNFAYWDNHYKNKPFFKDRGKWDKNWKQPIGANDGMKPKKDEKPIGMTAPKDEPKAGPKVSQDGPKVEDPKKEVNKAPVKKAPDDSAMRKGKPAGSDDCKPGEPNCKAPM